MNHETKLKIFVKTFQVLRKNADNLRRKLSIYEPSVVVFYVLNENYSLCFFLAVFHEEPKRDVKEILFRLPFKAIGLQIGLVTLTHDTR